MSARQQWNTLLKVIKKQGKKYAGRHVAMIDNKIVAAGKDEYALYRKVAKTVPRGKAIGLYYVPRPKDFMTLLWNSPIWR